MSEHIFILDSNSHANVVGVSRTAPRAPTVKAPDFEKPLRGDKSWKSMNSIDSSGSEDYKKITSERKLLELIHLYGGWWHGPTQIQLNWFRSDSQFTLW